jgi:hypothetical protein
LRSPATEAGPHIGVPCAGNIRKFTSYGASTSAERFRKPQDIYAVSKTSGTAAEISPKSWSEFGKKKFWSRVFEKMLARHDAKAGRLTASERELVRQRKKAIRLRKEAALTRRKQRRRERVSAQRRARTPQQAFAARQAKRTWYNALPEDHKKRIRLKNRRIIGFIGSWRGLSTF